MTIAIDRGFWEDSYITDLEVLAKLLFVYLLTNRSVNALGIYKVSLRRVSFDTGIQIDSILEFLEKFKNDKKVEYINGYICIFNYTRHHSYTQDEMIPAAKLYSELPLWLQIWVRTNLRANPIMNEIISKV